MKNKFFEFLKSNGLMLLLAVLILPYLISFVRKMIAKFEVDTQAIKQGQISSLNALDNPLYQGTSADLILKNYGLSSQKKEELKADVKAIAHHLGVNYPWYNFRSWSENDKDAATLIIKWILHTPKVIELYYSVYTQARNLRTDVHKFIDKDQKQRIFNVQQQRNISYY